MARPGVSRVAALAAAGAAVAAGTALGIATERGVIRRVLSPRPDVVPEPFGSLRGRVHRVIADDGISLHVEVDEPRGQGNPARQDNLTVVLCHGHALEQASWHFQRQALRQVARVVTWDQRSHGRSERAPALTHTIDHLAQDLRAVIEAVAPEGPVILVGHSMGGMTVLGLAAAEPELFGERVVGVGLVATSAGHLTEVPLGLPHIISRITKPIVPTVTNALVAQKDIVDYARRAASDLALLLTKRYSFASNVPTDTVEFVNAMLAATPIDVVVEFLPGFDAHEVTHALGVLQQVETLVIVGDHDLLTPASHSEHIVKHVPSAELIIVADTGHMLLLERPDVVNRALLDLLSRVRRNL